jgi:hypothetical protein
VQRILALKQENPAMFAWEIRKVLLAEFEQTDVQGNSTGPAIPSISSINRILRQMSAQSPQICSSGSSTSSSSPEPSSMASPTSSGASSPTSGVSPTAFGMLGAHDLSNTSAVPSLNSMYSNVSSFGASPFTSGPMAPTGLGSTNASASAVRPTSFGLHSSLFSSNLSFSSSSSNSSFTSGYGSVSPNAANLPPSPLDSPGSAVPSSGLGSIGVTSSGFAAPSQQSSFGGLSDTSGLSGPLGAAGSTGNFYRPPVTSRKYTSFNINEILSSDDRQFERKFDDDDDEDCDDEDEELDVDVQQFEYHAPSMFASTSGPASSSASLSAQSTKSDLGPASSLFYNQSHYFTYEHAHHRQQ